MPHAERLPGALADVLAAARLAPSALDLLAVASGPGAFTGLRVGLATVQGLALALDRPAVGVPSLAAAAWRYFDQQPAGAACAVWLDGARGDVFAAAFAPAGQRRGDWPLEEMVAPSVDDAVRDARALAPTPSRRKRRCCSAPGRRGREQALAAGRSRGRRRRAAGGAGRADCAGVCTWRGWPGPPHALAPLYVRRPDAEVERDRRRAVGVPSP